MSLSLPSYAELSFSNELWGAESYGLPTQSFVNPGNHFLQIPSAISEFDDRPELKWQNENGWFAVARFRAIYQDMQINFNDGSGGYNLQKGTVDITDLYISKELASGVETSFGLQNYQWGPGELYSPSNVFFHFNSQQKAFLYKEKGHVLARYHQSFENKNSLDLIVEPISNNTASFVDDQTFTPKSTIRFETPIDKDGSIAVLAGQSDLHRAFVGSYWNYYYADVLSIYGDGRATQGRSQYSPGVDPLNFVDLKISDPSDNNWWGFYLLGHRIEEKSFDLRIEYLRNEAGYDANQFSLWTQSLTQFSPYLNSNFFHAAHSGMEFLRRNYSYVSLRFPDLGPHKDSNIYLRHLWNLDDHSYVVQMDGDKNWNDNTVIYIEAQVFRGSANSEFRLAQDYSIAAGFRRNW